MGDWPELALVAEHVKRHVRHDVRHLLYRTLVYC